MDELRLRIKAILRRTPPVKELERSLETSQLQVGEVVLDCRAFRVKTPVGTAQLTNVQFDLLYHLMSHADHVFSSQQLLQDVWDYPKNTGSSELVRAHIKNLREKIEPEPRQPRYIRTVQGHGYTFTTD
jgi:DNA-binding response OmpR family regulator